MAIKGSLREASLADVCQLLSMGQKTGCLSVTDRSRFGQIYFDRGRITFATIVNRRDRLGDLLVRDGVIRHDQLRQVIERQAAQPDRRLGELLVESGLLTRERLGHYIRIQAEEAVYSLFSPGRAAASTSKSSRSPMTPRSCSRSTRRACCSRARGASTSGGSSRRRSRRST